MTGNTIHAQQAFSESVTNHMIQFLNTSRVKFSTPMPELWREKR
jgi:hypothetical protein